MSYHHLFIVATPIGNLEDISYRSKRVLTEIEHIFAEDTRNSKKLLTLLGINIDNKKFYSYHKFNEKKKLDEMFSILQEKDVAIISDAGMPSISDPAQIAIEEAVRRNCNIVIVPGATAPIMALIASGFKNNSFSFHGFLPDKKKQRIEIFFNLKDRDEILIFFDVPHRIKDTLNDMLEVFGEKRRIVIAREMTKMYEEYLRGNISEVINEINKRSIIKGELTIVVEGNKEETINSGTKVNKDEAIEILYREWSKDHSLKECATIISEMLNIKKNYVYNYLLKR